MCRIVCARPVDFTRAAKSSRSRHWAKIGIFEERGEDIHHALFISGRPGLGMTNVQNPNIKVEFTGSPMLGTCDLGINWSLVLGHWSFLKLFGQRTVAQR